MDDDFKPAMQHVSHGPTATMETSVLPLQGIGSQTKLKNKEKKTNLKCSNHR